MKLHNIHSFRILSIGFCFALVASCKKENVQTESQTNPEPQPTVQQGPSFSESEKEAQRNAAVALLAAIESDLAAGKKSIIVPPGDYRFDQRKGVRFHRLEGVEIDATGATFWFGPGNGVVFEECRNSKLLGLTIDSDPLPWTQGVIEEIDPKTETIMFRVDEGYRVLEGKELTQPGRILYFDGKTRLELPVFDDQALAFESLGERRLKITKFNTARVFRDGVPGRPVQIGDLVAFFIMYGGGGGVSLHDCEGVRLENVTNHGASAFAFHETEGKGGNQYIGCKLIRRPGTNRLMASRADCFHSASTEKGPLIENCEFSHSGDDLIAIHGFFGVILRVVSPKEIIVASPFVKVLNAGSKLEISDPEGATTPREVTVQTEERIQDAAVLAEAKALPEVLFRERKLRIRDLNTNCVARVVLDQEIPLQKYDVVSAPDHSGRGAIVRNNYLHDGHVRGVLVKSEDLLIENNRIERTGHAGIIAESEFYWLEGPFNKNIRILNNRLVQNGWATFDKAGFTASQAAVHVGSYFGQRMFPRTFASGLHNSDIQITGNRIERPAGFGITVLNTRGATITDNVIVSPFAAGERPAYYDFSKLPDDAAVLTAEQREQLKSPRDAIFIYGSQDVTLKGNSVQQAPAFLKSVSNE